MEVAPYNIGVSISFPPDTDTPQLQAELGERSEIQTELASFGTVFQAPTIARDVWSGVEVGKFQIVHGFDGFMLGVVTAGMSPVTHVWDMVTQVRMYIYNKYNMFRRQILIRLYLLCHSLGCTDGCVPHSVAGLPVDVQSCGSERSVPAWQ